MLVLRHIKFIRLVFEQLAFCEQFVWSSSSNTLEHRTLYTRTSVAWLNICSLHYKGERTTHSKWLLVGSLVARSFIYSFVGTFLIVSFGSHIVSLPAHISHTKYPYSHTAIRKSLFAAEKSVHSQSLFTQSCLSRILYVICAYRETKTQYFSTTSNRSVRSCVRTMWRI